MTAKDAYIKAGYKSKNPRKEAYRLRQNQTITDIIEERKAEKTQNIDDWLAFEEFDSFKKLVEIRDLPLDKETYHAVIKSCVEIIDRRRGKARQAIDVGGQKDNPIIHQFLEVSSANTIDNEPIDEDDEE